MHAYDKDKLSGPLKVTRAKNSEMFHPLSGKSHELNSNDLVIRGSKEVQALGGIIGSMNSACSENTKNITLEAAIFDKDLITATGRKLGIETDARYRFERQTDIALLVPTSLAAARMMVDICGGEIAKVELSGSVEYKAEAIELDVKTINSFTAADIGIEISAKILQDLGFSVKSYNDKLEATPPSWRHDISIKEDLIEEIVRIYDFEKIPMVPIPVDVKFRLALNNTNYTNIARRVIASLGYDELITYSFMSSKHAKLFTSLKRHCDERSDEAIHNNKMDRPTTLCSVRDDGLVLDRQEPLGPEVTLPNLYLKNPISSDLDYMRPSILPNFLSVVAKNATRSINKGALFEVGPVFTGVKAEEELLFASGVSWGKIENNLHSNREVDIFDVKADIILLLQELGLSVDALSYKIDDLPSYYHPTRSAAIMIGKNLLGYFGEIHPIILKEYDIEQRIVAFEINLSSLPEARLKYGLKPNYKVSDYQMNVRDFAFLVDEAVQIGPVAKIINSIDKALIRNVEIFDIYKGEKIESGKKSVAISVSIQADDRTLSEGELHDLHSKIIASIEKFGGEIRK
jgi:phenylalanyl-tRNA synthetase beta chain